MTGAPIALISAEYPPAPGGVGDYTACLAAALGRAGCTVHVLTSQDAADAAGTAPGVTVHRAIADWRWPCWGEIRDLLDRIRPGIADIQYQTGAYRLHGAINLLPWRERGRPDLAWVTTFHDLREPYLFPKAGPVRRWANEALMRASRGIVVTNPQDEAALPAWARARAAGIPIGANIAPQPPAGWNRAAWRAEHGIAHTTALVAYFGFFNAGKGLETLIGALDRLRGAGADIMLLLVGGGTGMSDPTNAQAAAALLRAVADRHLEAAVQWTGYVTPEEVSAALLSADLAALPFLDGASLRRGSLLAVLAHGLPLITTTPQPVPSSRMPWPTLHDDENALLVPPGETQALAAAMQRLMSDPALSARLGTSRRALAAAFDWDRIAAQHLALFERIMPVRSR
jgi:glycosyltransferase involved in cell wall biosynthesis